MLTRNLTLRSEVVFVSWKLYAYLFPSTLALLLTMDEHSEPETRQPSREQSERLLHEFMQELRVVLPGVQVLFAFLLTVPFSQRFYVSEEFFDLSQDPFEEHNIVDERDEQDIQERRNGVVAWRARVNAVYEGKVVAG